MADAASADELCAARAQYAVAELRKAGASFGANTVPALYLVSLLNPPDGAANASATAAASDAAFEAGAFPFLLALLQRAARGASDGLAQAKVCCATASLTLGLLVRAGGSQLAAALAAVPSAADEIGRMLEALASVDAGCAHRACFALHALCVHGAPPGDAAAAAAARGATLTLQRHPASPYVKDTARFVCWLLDSESAWPKRRHESAVAAFFAADGLNVLVAAADAQQRDDQADALSALMRALLLALDVAPTELAARLAADELVFKVIARALGSSTLSTRLIAVNIAGSFATADTGAFTRMARTAVLDAAVACVNLVYPDGADVDKQLSRVCLGILNHAALSGAVPGDITAALCALKLLLLANAEGTPRTFYVVATLHSLCAFPGVKDAAIAVGMAGTLVAVCSASIDSKCMHAALMALSELCHSSAPGTEATLRAGGINVAARALQAHMHNAANGVCEVIIACCSQSREQTLVAFAAAGGLRLMVRVLLDHGSADRLLAGLALRLLLEATREPRTCDVVTREGGIAAITAAMRAHNSDHDVQLLGSYALADIAQKIDELEDQLSAARAPAAVVAAILAHVTHDHVRRVGVRALAALCMKRATQRWDAAADAVAAGAPAALIAALHTAHAQPDEKAHIALASLLTTSAWPPDGEAWRLSVGALIDFTVEHWRTLPVGSRPDLALKTLFTLMNALVAGTPGVGGARKTERTPPGAATVFCVALRIAAETAASPIGYSRSPGMLTVTISSFATLAIRPGGLGAAFCADAVACGAVEQLATIASSAARPGRDQSAAGAAARQVCAYTLRCLSILTQDSTAATCRAAACNVYALVDACTRADGFAGVEDTLRRAMSSELGTRLRSVVAEHGDENGAGRCPDPDCDLQLMSRRRCCKRGCALAATGDMQLKRCGTCLQATFCCQEHIREAWPLHKPVCNARAAVKAACEALQAPPEAAAQASDDA